MAIDIPSPATAPQERRFTPRLPALMLVTLHEYVKRSMAQAPDQRAAAMRDMARHGDCGQDEVALRASCLVLADLLDQGWLLDVRDNIVWLMPPVTSTDGNEPVEAVKSRLRGQLEIARLRQLREPAVQEFVRRMERRREYAGRLVSVRDLVDSGYELAQLLSPICELPCAQRDAALARVIEPVVEVCDTGTRCTYTGLLLLDIWRYFRHTWALEYRPTPGRTLPLLIRNAARPNAPVIGIAMLASAATRLRTRDRWIGWDIGALREHITDKTWSSTEIAAALCAAVDDAIKDIRSDDLLPEYGPDTPTSSVVQALRDAAAAAERDRYDLLHTKATGPLHLAAQIDLRNPPTDIAGQTDWLAASERPLFRRKRAATMAQLLSARIAFTEADMAQNPDIGLQRLLGSERGRVALNAAFVELRKRALASHMADVSVCGAIPPYNELLGGKLVTLLAGSRDVRDAYRTRYAGQVSEIASQLAGRPIRRPAELSLLTTTSLYGVGSSQYNRLRLRKVDYPELGRDVAWINLGHSGGFGTAHLTRETVEALRLLSTLVHGARRINSIFGEGSSPRLRQVREGLEALGIDSDAILHHGTPRGVYAYELVPHARQRLIGIAAPISVEDVPSASVLASAWRRRWLARRIKHPGILERVADTGPGTISERLLVETDGQYRLAF